MDAIQFLILALAVWRVSSLLAREEGPGRVFDHIRHLVGVRYEEGEVIFLNQFAKGIACMWCISVHIGLWVAVAYFLFGQIIVYILSPLALSAVAAIVDRLVEN